MTSPTALKSAANGRCLIGEFCFDMEGHRLLQGSAEIPLRPKCLILLQYLVEHRGHLVSKSELMSAIWPDSFVTENSLMQCLTELRRALGGRERHILKTLSRRGYLLQADEWPDPKGRSSLTKDGEPESARKLTSEKRQASGAVDPSTEEVQPKQMPRCLWQRLLNLYFDLCQTASTISNYEHPAVERSRAEKAFWVIYWGPLVLVADEFYVAPAARTFALALDRGAPAELLRTLSFALAMNCRKSLKLSQQA